MAGPPLHRQEARRLESVELALLAFVALDFALVGFRLLEPTNTIADQLAGVVFLLAGFAVFSPLVFPRGRRLRAAAGATAFLAPASRAILLLADYIDHPDGNPTDLLVSVLAWTVVAALLLFVWVRLPLAPHRR